MLFGSCVVFRLTVCVPRLLAVSSVNRDYKAVRFSFPSPSCNITGWHILSRCSIERKPFSDFEQPAAGSSTLTESPVYEPERKSCAVKYCTSWLVGFGATHFQLSPGFITPFHTLAFLLTGWVSVAPAILRSHRWCIQHSGGWVNEDAHHGIKEERENQVHSYSIMSNRIPTNYLSMTYIGDGWSSKKRKKLKLKRVRDQSWTDPQVWLCLAKPSLLFVFVIYCFLRHTQTMFFRILCLLSIFPVLLLKRPSLGWNRDLRFMCRVPAECCSGRACLFLAVGFEWCGYGIARSSSVALFLLVYESGAGLLEWTVYGSCDDGFRLSVIQSELVSGWRLDVDCGCFGWGSYTSSCGDRCLGIVV